MFQKLEDYAERCTWTEREGSWRCMYQPKGLTFLGPQTSTCDFHSYRIPEELEKLRKFAEDQL